VDLSDDRNLRQGRELRFVAPLEVEVVVCSYNLKEAQRTHTRTCTTPEVRKRFPVALPIGTASSETSHATRLADGRMPRSLKALLAKAEARA
jgi:hypothetical protein